MLLFRFLAKHVVAILGGLILVLPVLRAIKGAVGIGGDIDFVLSRSQDPAWLRPVINWLLQPPDWAVIPIVFVGLALIWLDLKRPWRRTTPWVEYTPTRPVSEHIPLAEIAGEIMAWAQENGLSTAARLAAAEPAGQLRFYARLVLDTGEVFGAVPPSSALQRIDRNNYDINIDADGTMTAFRIFTDRLAYTNLAIRAADKQEIMGEMERKAHTLDN